MTVLEGISIVELVLVAVLIWTGLFFRLRLPRKSNSFTLVGPDLLASHPKLQKLFVPARIWLFLFMAGSIFTFQIPAFKKLGLLLEVLSMLVLCYWLLMSRKFERELAAQKQVTQQD